MSIKGFFVQRLRSLGCLQPHALLEQLLTKLKNGAGKTLGKGNAGAPA
jgi:hypothetical protein